MMPDAHNNICVCASVCVRVRVCIGHLANENCAYSWHILEQMPNTLCTSGSSTSRGNSTRATFRLPPALPAQFRGGKRETEREIERKKERGGELSGLQCDEAIKRPGQQIFCQTN